MLSVPVLVFHQWLCKSLLFSVVVFLLTELLSPFYINKPLAMYIIICDLLVSYFCYIGASQCLLVCQLRKPAQWESQNLGKNFHGLVSLSLLLLLMLQMCIIALPSCLYLFVLTIRAYTVSAYEFDTIRERTNNTSESVTKEHIKAHKSLYSHIYLV